jgi:hypothetical protein
MGGAAVQKTCLKQHWDELLQSYVRQHLHVSAGGNEQKKDAVLPNYIVHMLINMFPLWKTNLVRCLMTLPGGLLCWFLVHNNVKWSL